MPVSNGVKKVLSSEKLAEYKARADEKDVSLDEYIRRREEKYAAKQASRHTSAPLSAGSGNPKGNGIASAHDQDADVNHSSDSKSVKFIIDIVGEDPEADGKIGPAARQAIREGRAITLYDDEGKATSHWEPDTPVPVDIRLWQDVKANTLPRPVRKARLEWLKQRRAERKAKPVAREKSGKQKPKQTKGQRNIEAREELVKQVLVASRKALINGSQPETMEVNGVANVPLVKVTSTNGQFSKAEMALARSASRSALKRAKQEAKQEKKAAVGRRGPKRKSVKPFVRKSSTRHLPTGSRNGSRN